MKGKMIFAIALMLFYSCENKNSHPAEFEKLNWIEGNWEIISDSIQFYESWTKANDTLFSGKAFIIAAGDTVFSETVSIVKNGKNIFYIANVSDQNEGKPVPFKLISSDKNELIFENEEHDFPNKIYYSNISPDSIFAKIEGIRDGKIHSELFPFSRKK